MPSVMGRDPEKYQLRRLPAAEHIQKLLGSDFSLNDEKVLEIRRRLDTVARTSNRECLAVIVDLKKSVGDKNRTFVRFLFDYEKKVRSRALFVEKVALGLLDKYRKNGVNDDQFQKAVFEVYGLRRNWDDVLQFCDRLVFLRGSKNGEREYFLNKQGILVATYNLLFDLDFVPLDKIGNSIDHLAKKQSNKYAAESVHNAEQVVRIDLERHPVDERYPSLQNEHEVIMKKLLFLEGKFKQLNGS